MTKTMSAKQKEERSSDIQDLLCNLPFCVLPCRQQDSKPELTKQLPVCQVCDTTFIRLVESVSLGLRSGTMGEPLSILCRTLDSIFSTVRERGRKRKVSFDLLISMATAATCHRKLCNESVPEAS